MGFIGDFIDQVSQFSLIKILWDLFFCKVFHFWKKLIVFIFGAHGEVSSVKIIIDRDTGRSKGFGFVEMPDDDAARTAIDACNEQEVGGRPLKVNEARPRPDRGPRREPRW